MNGSMSDALGPFGANPRITVDGIEYQFVFDVPRLVAEMEQLCLQWRRELMAKEVESLGPSRNTPGTWEAQKADELWAEYRQEVKNGELRPGGAIYREWSQSKDGRHSSLLAALRLTRPGATMDTIQMLIDKEPDQVRGLFETLGNVMREAILKRVASLKTADPEAATMIERSLQAQMDAIEKRIRDERAAAIARMSPASSTS